MSALILSNMKKIDKFLTILYLLLCTIIITGLIIFVGNLADKAIYGVTAIIFILSTSRSYHLENYLRLIDSCGKLSYLQHLSGILNNWKKAIGLVMFIRPILVTNEFKKERQTINLLTVGIYVIISLMTVFIIKFT